MENLYSLSLLKNNYKMEFTDLIRNFIILNVFIEGLKIFSEYVKNNFSETVYNFMNIFFRKNKIEIVGYETLRSSGNFTFDYPYPMQAISHYIHTNKNIHNLHYFDKSKNNIVFPEDCPNKNNRSLNYSIGKVKRIELTEEIYLDVYKALVTKGKEINSQTAENVRVTFRLHSKTKTTSDIKKLIEYYCNEYRKNVEKNTNGKLYHFIFQGFEEGYPQFITNVLSESENKNVETFDTIFHKHKECIMKDIEKLHDNEYYQKRGIKRKKGYLFYGHPGCGKTSTVMAIANHDNRHIIEIPLSRIKTNKEFEEIMNVNEINGINFSKENIIILFDEIDRELKNTEKMSSDKMTLVKNTELTLSTILSRLDGIGNYNGLVVIATTNNKNELDNALYRDGRLNPMFFDYCSKEDVEKMMLLYYEKEYKIDFEIKEMSHSTLRKYLENYDVENFMEIIRS